MRFACRCLLLLLACAGLCPAQVVLNEILYRIDPADPDPLRSTQWVELYNKGSAAVDLSGWTITGRDGPSGAAARPLPAVQLPAGAYLTVHFTSGSDRLDFAGNTADSFTGDAGPPWSPDMDEAALYAPSGIVDFVAWSADAVPYAPGQAHADAVTAGIWAPNAALASDGITVESYEKPRLVAPGMSIGRDPDSTDTDSTADFEPNGGVGALGNSPNRRNLDQITVVELDPPSAGPAGRPGPRAATGKKWTVMLYFNADNSLEKYIFGNVKEIERAGGSTADVNYVLMYDGKRFGRGTQLGLIRAGGNPAQLTLERVLGASAQIGERNMGDPAELKGFIEWTKTNYPADRYALILSAHGDGWKGYGPDETSVGPKGPDFLYMGELRQALAGQHFDLIGFDACLMAGIEVAGQVREFTDYYLASEETIPADGYPYDKFVAALNASPGWTGKDLGAKIVQLYGQRFAGFSAWTLSLTDEGRLAGLLAQVDSWAKMMRTGMGLVQSKDDLADNPQIGAKFDPQARSSLRTRTSWTCTISPSTSGTTA
jgi:hypothetical protein